MAVTALYVHVPFCAQKCRYCDFDSRSFASCDLDAALDSYFEQLYARLDAFGKAGALDQIRTVYVGGGTPSLAGERLVELARRIRAWCAPVEFTCEANPESLTAELATALAKVGVTRVSLGVQTLDNNELTAIGRVHDADRALAAIATVKNAGLDASCDLMCGLPGQTATSWNRTLVGVLAAASHHVSVYPLTLEEGTPLYRMAWVPPAITRMRWRATRSTAMSAPITLPTGPDGATWAWVVLPRACSTPRISTVLQVCSPVFLLEAMRTACVWCNVTMTRRRTRPNICRSARLRPKT